MRQKLNWQAYSSHDRNRIIQEVKVTRSISSKPDID